MFKNIVMTSGVSIFGSYNIFGKLTREKNIFEFDRTNPVKPAGEEVAIKDWLKVMRKNFDKIEGNEHNISAEYSLVHALQKQNKLDKKPIIDLLHSENFGGKASAALIEDILVYIFNAEVNSIEIKELDVTDRLKLNRGLGDFMARLNKVLEDKHSQFTCFAPIGGYKVFSYFGYIAGSLNDLPTAYLHEDKQVLQEIPPVPISYDTGFILDNDQFLRRLYFFGGSLEEFNYQEKEIIGKYSHFFDFADDLVDINAFGILICKKYFPHIFAVQVYLSKEAQDVIESNPSNKQFAYQQLRNLAQKLDEGIKDWDLYHEREFKNLNPSELEYSLYKASQGEFRATWKYDASNKELFVNYIWFNHKRYEREVEQGKGLRTNKDGFGNYSKMIY